MQCQTCRDALSARIDGEETGVPEHLLELHLGSCGRCRSFAADAAVLRRRLAVRPAEAVPDLTGAILAGAPVLGAGPPAGRPAAPGHGSRWLLLAVALTQLALALPGLLGREAGASVHVAREAGGWDLALGVAWLVAALRPSHARGLLAFSLTLGAVLVAGAVLDTVQGRIPFVEESHHVLTLAGIASLAVVARHGDGDDPLLGRRASRPSLAT